MINVNHQKGMSTATIVLILVVVLIAAGFLYFNYRDENPQQEQVNDEEVIRDVGEEFVLPPATNPPLSADIMGGETSTELGDDEILALLLNDSGTQAAFLESVDGSESSGAGYRLVKGGKLYHGVIATMPNLKDGNVYEGWLVQKSPLKFISTGLMRSPENGVWVLEYTAQQEYPTYLKVVITEETEVDATPERHVIEGSF